MTLRNGSLLLPMFLLLLSAVAEADPPDEFSADRPGFADSPETVPPGFLQLEGGGLVNADQANGVTVHGVVGPQPLVRLGLIGHLELRFGGDGYVWQSVEGAGVKQSVQGLSDLGLAVKVRLWKAQGWRPAAALVPSVTFPTGAAAFTSSRIDPQLKLDWAASLSHDLGLGGSLALASRSNGDGRQTANAESLSVSCGLPASFGAFVEVFRVGVSGGDTTFTLDGGFSRLFGLRTQLDLSGGHTLGKDSHFWFVSAGVAVRVSLHAPRGSTPASRAMAAVPVTGETLQTRSLVE
jgi:hypothetical protein